MPHATLAALQNHADLQVLHSTSADLGLWNWIANIGRPKCLECDVQDPWLYCWQASYLQQLMPIVQCTWISAARRAGKRPSPLNVWSHAKVAGAASSRLPDM